jgi:dTDP-glucose 4,6-dehydratase
MKLLITGGAGFIGSNFVHYWLNTHPSDQLAVLDKLTYAGNKANLATVMDKIAFVEGDICDSAVVEQAMTGCDAVVHFAAESHVDRSVLDPSVFVRSNVLGTQVLLDTARKLGNIRFHHVSTDEVYGSIDLDSDEVWTEASPYNPRSPYSASKAGSDHLARAAFYTHQLPVTITNCANNIGPFMFPEKFLPLAITNLLDGKKVPIYGTGLQVREWLWVDDHCRAIDLVLQQGRAGETYFVGPNNPHLTNLDVIKKVLTKMGHSEEMLEFVTDRPGHDQKYALDHSKITRELGWEPTVAFDEALDKLITWYTDNRAWWEPLKAKAAL